MSLFIALAASVAVFDAAGMSMGAVVNGNPPGDSSKGVGGCRQSVGASRKWAMEGRVEGIPMEEEDDLEEETSQFSSSGLVSWCLIMFPAEATLWFMKVLMMVTAFVSVEDLRSEEIGRKVLGRRRWGGVGPCTSFSSSTSLSSSSEPNSESSRVKIGPPSDGPSRLIPAGMSSEVM